MTWEGFSPISIYDVTKLKYCSYCFKCNSIPAVHKNKECDGCKEFVSRNPSYWPNGSEENFERIKLLTFVYVKCFVNGCTFETDRPYLIKKHLVRFHNLLLSNNRGNVTGVEMRLSSLTPAAITNIKTEQVESLATSPFLPSVKERSASFHNLTNNSRADNSSSSSSTGSKNKRFIQKIVPIIHIKRKMFPFTEVNPESCFQTSDNGTDAVSISSEASSAGRLSHCKLGESSKVDLNGTLLPPSESASPSSPEDISYISGEKNDIMTDRTNYIPKEEHWSDCSLNSWEEQKPKKLNRSDSELLPSDLQDNKPNQYYNYNDKLKTTLYKDSKNHIDMIKEEITETTVQADDPGKSQYVNGDEANEALAHDEYFHSGLETFCIRCIFCVFSTQYTDSMRGHIAAKHVSSISVVIERDGALVYDCRHCEEKKDKKTLIASHYLAKHMTYTSLHCEACNVNFNDGYRFREHLKTEKHKVSYRRSYRCKYCGFGSYSNQRLRKHNIEMHGKDYKCDLCSFTTKFKRRLRRHRVAVHFLKKGDNGTYNCDECDFSSTNKVALYYHLNAGHVPSA